jgi:hypothetical protein
VLLALTTRFRSARPGARPAWRALALDAWAALGDADRHLGPACMRSVQAQEDDTPFPPTYRLAWYGAAFDALRRMDPPGLVPWLQARALRSQPVRPWREAAALTALEGTVAGMSGSLRYAAARALARSLGGRYPRAGAPRLGRDRLRDQCTLARLLVRRGGGREDLQATEPVLRAWWARHRSPDDALWKD